MKKPKPKPKLGTCCACGYSGGEETDCPKMDDGTHCDHYWDGPEETPKEVKP